jgi:hypothetical protein
MKAKIAIAVSALLLGTITTANADLYLESPRGLTQSQWNNSDTYQNFICPAGYGRGEGVDMNFTSTRSDDFWFVRCTPIQVTTIIPMPTTTPTPVVTPAPTQSETSTATVTPSVTTPVSNNTATVISETTTAVTETTTATSTSTTFESLYAQIMALFTQLLALIAKLKG